MKTSIIRLSLLLAILSVSLFSLNAQVTIGSDTAPEKAALLDIKTKDGGDGQISSDSGGLLLPRVELDNIFEFTVFSTIKKTDPDYDQQKRKHVGLAVYNIKTDYTKNIEQGIYIWNGERWEKSASVHRVNFFYMPSISIDTSSPGEKTPIDLYAEYKRQFETPKIKSDNAPDMIPFFVNSSDLYYYITDFDESVFDKDFMTIDANGLLRYKVINPTVDGTSYINIVFVVK